MERLTPGQGGRSASRVNRREAQGEGVILTLLTAGPVGEDGAHHALYEVVLPAGSSLPGKLPFGSVAVVVQSGSILAVSEGEIVRTIEPLTRTIDDAESVSPPERPVLNTEPIAAGRDVPLRTGEAVTVSGNDLSVRNEGTEPARLLLSAVLDAVVMDNARCWICPRPWEPWSPWGQR